MSRELKTLQHCYRWISRTGPVTYFCVRRTLRVYISYSVGASIIHTLIIVTTKLLKKINGIFILKLKLNYISILRTFNNNYIYLIVLNLYYVIHTVH